MHTSTLIPLGNFLSGVGLIPNRKRIMERASRNPREGKRKETG